MCLALPRIQHGTFAGKKKKKKRKEKKPANQIPGAKTDIKTNCRVRYGRVQLTRDKDEILSKEKVECTITLTI